MVHIYQKGWNKCHNCQHLTFAGSSLCHSFLLHEFSQLINSTAVSGMCHSTWNSNLNRLTRKASVTRCDINQLIQSVLASLSPETKKIIMKHFCKRLECLSEEQSQTLGKSNIIREVHSTWPELLFLVVWGNKTRKRRSRVLFDWSVNCWLNSWCLHFSLPSFISDQTRNAGFSLVWWASQVKPALKWLLVSFKTVCYEYIQISNRREKGQSILTSGYLKNMKHKCTLKC